MTVVMRCGTVMMLDRKNVCALVNGDDEIGKRWMLCWPNEGRLHEHVTIYNTSPLSSQNHNFSGNVYLSCSINWSALMPISLLGAMSSVDWQGESDQNQ